MYLKKAYVKVDWRALREMLMTYGIGGRLLEGIEAFYKRARACVRVDGDLSECFDISIGLR